MIMLIYYLYIDDKKGKHYSIEVLINMTMLFSILPIITNYIIYPLKGSWF